jgi:uncharacterized damage-inducible protein DinB
VFRRVEDFVNEYKQLRDATQTVLAALTDQNLGQQVHKDHRTLGRLAWHLAISIPEMMNRTGVGLSSLDPEAPLPSSADAIRDAYARASQELVTAVASQWEDETLLETDPMYGEPWPRGFTLTALIQHEIHHRGQMTVLLRQAGAPVPGLFGPSKEEWAEFGAQPPAI